MKDNVIAKVKTNGHISGLAFHRYICFRWMAIGLFSPRHNKLNISPCKFKVNVMAYVKIDGYILPINMYVFSFRGNWPIFLRYNTFSRRPKLPRKSSLRWGKFRHVMIGARKWFSKILVWKSQHTGLIYITKTKFKHLKNKSFIPGNFKTPLKATALTYIRSLHHDYLVVGFSCMKLLFTARLFWWQKILLKTIVL